MILVAQMAQEQVITPVIVVFAMLYCALGTATIFICGDGFLSILYGRTRVFVVLIEYAVILVGFVALGGLIVQATESIVLTLVAAYVYLGFVWIRLKDPFIARFNALSASSSAGTGGSSQTS